MITPENIEEKYQIQIYTDSSLKNINGISYASYGYIMDSQLFNLRREDYRISEGTVSLGEMSGILLALIELETLLRMGVINNNCNIILFSDSEYCVNTLTKWIFSWFNNRDGDFMIKSSGGRVAHQNIIDEIIRIIISNNFKINIFHTYGHVDTFKRIEQLKNKLRKNGFKASTSFVKQIANCNNVVDSNSRRYFNNFNNTNVLEHSMIFKQDFNNQDIKQYKKMIKKI